MGIDTAWTPTQPSGVALLRGGAEGWDVVAVAPSYASFLGLAEGRDVDWSQSRFKGDKPNVKALIAAAERIADVRVDLVAIDMPVATVPFATRRFADQAVSRAFGGKGCAAHSPNEERPGRLGAKLMRDLEHGGFPLETRGSGTGGPRTIEVYPHPALLKLLDRTYRVPYKVSKSGRYWRGESVAARIANLLEQFVAIHEALAREVGDPGFRLPSPSDVKTLTFLKRYEDALDALVCAWVAAQHLAGRTDAFGDSVAAIWVPN